jgi:predicted RNA-binding Zn ribbon-like protein
MDGMRYPGPLGGQLISIELHNTLYTVAGSSVDGLDDPVSRAAFLREITPRIHPESIPDNEMPPVEDLLGLRNLIRVVLHTVIDGQPHHPATMDGLNAFAAKAPTSIQAELAADDPHTPVASTNYHQASPADIILAAFAADAIDVITAELRCDLRACDAPGCVMVYLKADPRQQWCSKPCGNRARQARHYHRTHQT